MEREFEMETESKQEAIVVDGGDNIATTEDFTIEMNKEEATPSDISVKQLLISLLQHKTTACKVTTTLFDGYTATALFCICEIKDKDGNNILKAASAEENVQDNTEDVKE